MRSIFNFSMAMTGLCLLASSFLVSSAHAKTKDDSDGLIHVNSAERASYIQSAQILAPVDLDSARFARVKDDPGSPFPSDSIIECNYHDKKRGSGQTRKFACGVVQVTDANGNVIPSHGETIKVRYATPKVYSMTITTRLAKTLGFNADTETPLQKVICHGCTSDPFYFREVSKDTHIFTNVSMEVALPGQEIYQDGAHYFQDNGEKTSAWYWSELPSTPEGDALRLFAAFLKDNDTKAIQNKIVCQAPLVNGKCANPILYVHDFGNTLGHDGFLIDLVHYQDWSNENVWADETKCIAKVDPDFFNFNGLHNPGITEAGRALLATRLQTLLAHDNLLHQIFETAHIETRNDRGQSYSADDWARAFRAKAMQIIYHSCPN